ncbi:RluA family pseudouridine synthase [Campylobacter gracilis]|uniref:RluA family pseudouridine synthase n=1 Tax=Campylobacter gracilis TaxID=824 RepID=UPI0026EBBA1C|nr:RluA family pseudouridine synthase [Campylobacter gracilis]
MDNLIAQCSQRLDVFLSSQLGISRNQISNLIKSTAVRVDGAVQTKPGYKLSVGELVHIDYPAPAPQQTSADRLNFDVEILYEDDDLLVVNKPAGLTVHPAASVKEPTLVDWLKSRGYLLSTLGGELRAGIVHRLDKLTSGALLVAKNNAAHAVLSAQLSDKSMGRIYLALIDLPLKEPCVIERPISRNPANRLKMGIVPGGRSAKSAFYEILSGAELSELQNSAERCDKILSTSASDSTAAGKSAGADEILNNRADNADKILTAKMSANETRAARLAENKFLNFKNPAQNYKLPPINLKSFNLVAAKLFTGRTHQIRVHLSSINRHILGDHLYGFKSENAKISRILLHAYLLYFIHPRSGKEVKICAGLPSEFLNFTTNQKVKDEIYEKILPTNVERYFSDTSGWLRYV